MTCDYCNNEIKGHAVHVEGNGIKLDYHESCWVKSQKDELLRNNTSQKRKPEIAK